jgi:hypothetical protein
MNGVFQGIDFGTGQWRWETACPVNPTNHIYFADSTGTSRSFQFAPALRVLESMRVFAERAGTLTLSDDAGQTLTLEVAAGSRQLVTTGWTLASTTVTVDYTSGWDLGVDDITYSDVPPGGCAGAGPCTITLTDSTTVIARFSAPRPTLSVILEGLGSGTVTSAPAGITCGTTCSRAYDNGTVVTLTAIPAGGSRFSGWSGDCTDRGPCTITLEAATSVTARFESRKKPKHARSTMLAPDWPADEIFIELDGIP